MRALLPPLLLEQVRRWRGTDLRFDECPLGWEQAEHRSTGYSASDILARVQAATRAVIAGHAVAERDGVLLETPEVPLATQVALLRTAALHPGGLEVIDFGGSLGSTYRACRPLLDGVGRITWRVVEQPAFAAAGQAEFTNAELSFAGSLNELPVPGRESLALCAGVLQYLPDPHAVLEALTRLQVRHLMIDRTPLSDLPEDLLCVQRVPPQIYPASYPCWILSRQKLLRRLTPYWQVKAEFLNQEGGRRTSSGTPFAFKGLLLERMP
jgi:putative methyltransferase (TIGR04325 family)